LPPERVDPRRAAPRRRQDNGQRSVRARVFVLVGLRRRYRHRLRRRRGRQAWTVDVEDVEEGER